MKPQPILLFILLTFTFCKSQKSVTTDEPASSDMEMAEEIGTSEHQLLQVHIINVGQADGIIIQCPDGNHQLFIDGGELNFRYPGSQTAYENYVKKFQKASDPVEVVVASHPHSDHIAGLKWLIENYPIQLYVDNGRPHTSSTYQNLEAAIIENDITRRQLTEDATPDIDFCPRADVNAGILKPAGFNDPGRGINDYSIVLRVDYKDRSFLFTGDAEDDLEELLENDINTRALLDVDFLKVGHHGSNTSTKLPFVGKVTPQVAAISCGAKEVGTNKSHHHPKKSTLDLLFPHTGDQPEMTATLDYYDENSGQWQQLTTKEAVFLTSQAGDLVFLSDGSKIWEEKASL